MDPCDLTADGDDAPLERAVTPGSCLATSWDGARTGLDSARAEWRDGQGGQWSWQADGARVLTSGSEWASLVWDRSTSTLLGDSPNVVIDVTISGKAEAAGLSFGDFADFLAPLDGSSPRHHLQLEIDQGAGCFAFRVDGRLQGRHWWDSRVTSVDDLLAGTLTLKARRPADVTFQRLAVQTLQASCRVSVVITCYRFLQRLRIALRNWCHQDLPTGAYELLVVNPESPDGTHEHLAAVARTYPHLRVREIAVHSSLITNKGAMINRALAAARGEWIWVTDADCLFGPTSMAAVMRTLDGRSRQLFFGQRRHLSLADTDALLTGRVDGLHGFDALATAASTQSHDDAPWGYTQIFHRSTLQRVRYREELNHFAHTDVIFAEDCIRQAIMPRAIDGLFCLHLIHPFAWYGTTTFL
jgi:hypothetical protein